jgi:hypothetical protein
MVGIIEYALGQFEADSMLLAVDPVLARIPFKPHG